LYSLIIKTLEVELVWLLVGYTSSVDVTHSRC